VNPGALVSAGGTHDPLPALTKGEESTSGEKSLRKSFLRDAPGKEWDARRPEDKESFHSNSINTFLF
jgi:hypothetical protein